MVGTFIMTVPLSRIIPTVIHTSPIIVQLWGVCGGSIILSATVSQFLWHSDKYANEIRCH